MKNYFEEFYNRYEELKSDLEKKVGDLSSDENLKKAIENHHQLLNNIVMAGLGMGTLYLRMGAVLMIAEITNKSAGENDISFLKVIAEKLIHKLPADGDWLEIWIKFLEREKQSKWNEIISKSTQPDIHSAFVSLRNNIAHQKLVINSSSDLSKIKKALKILDRMTSFRIQFKQSIISTENNEVYFQYESDTEKLKISPYVQINKSEPDKKGVLPYLFQGRYYKGTKFINTEGAETEEEKDISLDETFDSINREIARFNGDKAFDFNDKIQSYNEWCIGRENEVTAILKWINDSETDKNVLPIFAPAGLGKGALVAEVIKELKGKQPLMFHFCSSGKTNNLHSVLYHFILQGKKMPGMNGVRIWESKDVKTNSQLQKFPSQYVDTITLFQNLLSNCTSLPQSHKGKAFVIILDGLDEAAVSDHSKRISDWFYTYDDKGERKEKWMSPDHIKWIFTYRQTTKDNKEGFQFDYHELNTHELSEVQPLKGLTEEAVKNGIVESFKKHEPSLTKEFIDTIIKKGAVK
jgi:hypothetical protein